TCSQLAERLFGGPRHVGCDSTPGLHPPGGQGIPAPTQASTAWTSWARDSGGVVRVPPGAKDQPTKGSTFTCSMSRSPFMPPFRAVSFTCAQICALVLPSQSMDSGASRQPGAPGTKPAAVLVSWWHV